MRKLIFVISLFFLSISLSAEILQTFPNLLKPNRIVVNGDKIYITEFPSVHIFSLKDGKLLKTFGRKGQGPQEFANWIDVAVKGESLLVNSQGKVTYWTLDGDFIKELKIPMANGLEQIEDKYAGIGHSRDKEGITYQTINIYNSAFKKEREIGRKKAVFQRGRSIAIFEQMFYFIVCDNKIYMTGNDGFLIEIYDKNGKKLFDISREYKKRKVTDKDIQEIYQWFKTNPNLRNEFEQLKPLMKFAEYFPAYQYFLEYDKKLYIRTFNKKDNKSEFFVYTLDGKFIKQIYLPIKSIDYRTDYPYYIYKDKLYHLIEDEDTEEWSLHVFPVQ